MVRQLFRTTMVYRRIGGLEIEAVDGDIEVKVYRRIGGLEILPETVRTC